VKETVDPGKFGQRANKRSSLNANAFVIILAIIGIAVLAFFMIQQKKGQDSSPPATAPQASQVAGNSDDDNYSEPDGDIEAGGDLRVGSVVNENNPGMEVQIEEFVQGDQMTIFDFYSQFCPPCRKISPWLKQLDEKRDDIIVFKVDINRSGVRGIDWRSPVAQQYGLKSIPHFIIYNDEGELILEGKPAYTKVLELLQEEGIVK
jgi:thiol-disulfide isomerase/thioredoxin